MPDEVTYKDVLTSISKEHFQCGTVLVDLNQIRWQIDHIPSFGQQHRAMICLSALRRAAESLAEGQNPEVHPSAYINDLRRIGVKI